MAAARLARKPPHPGRASLGFRERREVLLQLDESGQGLSDLARHREAARSA
jgi:hypothetical protein